MKIASNEGIFVEFWR